MPIIFDVHNLLGINPLTRLPLGLSHLHKHKSRHVNVAKILNQQCISFSTAQTFSIPRQTLFQKISNIDDSILPQS